MSIAFVWVKAAWLEGVSSQVREEKALGWHCSWKGGGGPGLEYNARGLRGEVCVKNNICCTTKPESQNFQRKNWVHFP